jgi:osmoprotectant transport system permease protein
LLLLLTDGLGRLRLAPAARLGLICAGLAVASFVLLSGVLDDLSLMREYQVRADSFWQEFGRHAELAFGTTLAAILLGAPLGILCNQHTRLARPVLAVLAMVQTIPSLALFGLLMAPLAWVALHVPAAAAVGIRGIGVAPAALALLLYALLPMVTNTLAGLRGVSANVRQAASGMGMQPRQILWRIDIPLAMPIILAGIRVVLVQVIGIATVAALIGGGGLGTFVFQGVGQTAPDLVLLGTIPIVLMAMLAGFVLDALAGLAKGTGR